MKAFQTNLSDKIQEVEVGGFDGEWVKFEGKMVPITDNCYYSFHPTFEEAKNYLLAKAQAQIDRTIKSETEIINKVKALEGPNY